MTPTADEILVVLRAVETGALTVEAQPPGVGYCGDVCYQASNGWVLRVFVDCDEWDYLDSIEFPDGTSMCFWPLVDGDERHLAWCSLPRDVDGNRAEPEPTDGYEAVRDYQPPADIAATVYRVEGRGFIVERPG